MKKRPSGIQVEGVPCVDCALGSASREDHAHNCPFIPRQYARGELLCLAGEPANTIWFLKQGAIGLARTREETDELEALRLPGSYIGLECLVGERYLFTARAMSGATLCGANIDSFRRWLHQSDERLAIIMQAVLGELLGGEEVDPATLPRPGDH